MDETDFILVNLDFSSSDFSLRKIHQSSAEDFQKEMSLMMHLRHPNLIQLLHVITQAAPQALVLEFMPGGSLTDWLQRQINPEQTQFLSLIHQVARGMSALASHGIGMSLNLYCLQLANHPSFSSLQPWNPVHRDLAARNVLICDEPLQAKVSDFGLSRAMRTTVTREDDEAACYYRAQTSRPMPVRWMV